MRVPNDADLVLYLIAMRPQTDGKHQNKTSVPHEQQVATAFNYRIRWHGCTRLSACNHVFLGNCKESIVARNMHHGSYVIQVLHVSWTVTSPFSPNPSLPLANSWRGILACLPSSGESHTPNTLALNPNPNPRTPQPLQSTNPWRPQPKPLPCSPFSLQMPRTLRKYPI